MAMAHVMLQRSPIVTLASGDEKGLTFEVPYRQTTALVQFATDEAHPSLGNGLLVRCSLPGGPGPGPTWAALRNRQELESLTRAHFLGSWVGLASFATHVCFYPNMVARTGLSVMNAAFSMINRIRWLAELGHTDA